MVRNDLRAWGAWGGGEAPPPTRYAPRARWLRRRHSAHSMLLYIDSHCRLFFKHRHFVAYLYVMMSKWALN